MKYLKPLIIILFVIMGSIFVIGSVNYKTIYNPFTGKLDYVINELTINTITGNLNITGNITTGNDDNIPFYQCLNANCSMFICANSTTILISNNNVGITC